MTISPLPVEIVTQSDQLDVSVREMASPTAIAIDTESNSYDHYPEQLCLIQIATRHKIHIIDTISLKEIIPLREVLADESIRKVIHGADYDIRSLDRHCGFRIRNIYDTSIAARFAGIAQIGLASLIKEFLGVTIPKSKRLQRTAWGRRPLSADSLDYAASDVRYLLALQETLDQQLHTLGRADWVAEECARLEEVRYTEPNLDSAYLSIKGAKKLDGYSLAILQSLFLFREKEARRQHRPPFFIIPDSALIYLACNPAATLSEIPGIEQTALHRFGRGLMQTLYDSKNAPPISRPRYVTTERFSQEQNLRLSSLKTWRASLGITLSLDPFVLWPTSSIERLAKSPGTLDAEIISSNVRRWQRDHVASSLRTHLESLQ